ncbi:hypothetical protein ACPF4D_003499 [Vibrio cholerae]|uniref:hypothetical protein n=1 Tax=Vibrio cholerae TaxID=666 RepID=UPI001A309F99|nr:hypothetical protein [Vibrio cholerae]EGR1465960.1 hypothetical protein [Vibrio cholerae]EJL6980294.1 hypothetical protein [Vibrio cholerae]EJU9689938.1 hypothetical protein [Vibrio cholerae]EKJ1030828.1 hypothetical protein [Vibrio cholerae]
MDDNVVWAVVSVLFSGCAIPIVKSAWRKLSEKNMAAEKLESEVAPQVTPTEPNELSYKEKLGLRHRELRVNLAGLTLAEMSEIYTLEEVSQLEEYESGVKELPKKLINVAKEYFNLKTDYFDPEIEQNFPFQTVRSSEYRKYLSEGYKPYIMCSPNERDWHLFAYMYLYREKNGLHQMVKASEKARFKSGHSGKMNVERLIHSMKNMGYDKDYAIVAHVSEEDWDLMENNRFYKKVRGYSIDYECMDIFDEWFKSYEL